MAQSLSTSPALQRFHELIDRSLRTGSLVRLTLSAPCGDDPTLKSVQARPVSLQDRPRLSFVYHYARRDITRNFTYDDARHYLIEVIGTEFRNAHLYTTQLVAQFEIRKGSPKLVEGPPQHTTAPSTSHDRSRTRVVGSDRLWLHKLGVTDAQGRVTRGMEPKFRQINKFVEIFAALLAEAQLVSKSPIDVVDMGCGKAYLTFAINDWLQRDPARHSRVRGIEAQDPLVDLGNRVAREMQWEGLSFIAGTIAQTPLETTDVLIALHACDTATDDALGKGIAAGAKLLIVSPCCHKELRPQLTAPPSLAGALRHGILAERQAEFITDALRAALLEWAGFHTKVFEFISTEHTAKNLMIAGVRRADGRARLSSDARRVRDLATFYGIRSHSLATRLGFNLVAE